MGWCAVRRSRRARAAPELYKPAWVVNEQGRITSLDELDETREGEEYQATLPELQPRPPSIPPEEKIWMQDPILTGQCCTLALIHHVCAHLTEHRTSMLL